VEDESAYYGVDVAEAAAILRLTPERVREMLLIGELEGIPPGATAQGDWKVLLPATPDLKEPTPVDEPSGNPPEEQEEAPANKKPAERFVEPPQDAADSEESAAARADLSRGDDAAITREPAAPSGWVSTQQAARALGISPRTVRWHIEQGNLQAKTEGEGVKRTWLVSIDSLQAFRDTRQAAGAVPHSYRAQAESADIAAETPSNAIRVLAERLEDAAARAAEYRVRLELTEQAASSVQAELAEERRRREAAERERDELRRRLETRSEPRDSPPAPAAAPQRETRPATGASRRGSVRRALWRRVFGG
jgi:Helix-turn-helix domain